MVLNKKNDGHVEYESGWLRRNGRNIVVAALAWELNAERRRSGFGGLVRELVAVHQLDHPD